MLGLLIAGAIAAWAPDSFWRDFFTSGHPTALVWGPIVGPIVATVSFCLLNRQRASRRGAVERRHQLRRGCCVHRRGLADPAVPNIYRKYYGTRMMLVLLGTLYDSMVCAGVGRRTFGQHATGDPTRSKANRAPTARAVGSHRGRLTPRSLERKSATAGHLSLSTGGETEVRAGVRGR